MLLRFGVENHRSLRSYQQIMLTAAPFKEHEDTLLLAGDGRTAVVPSAAVYGANAAGKSTVLHAMHFMRNAILFSHSKGNPSGGTAFAPFALDSDSQTRASVYDIDIEVDGIRHHYGFKLDGSTVLEEWLYATPLNRARRSRQTWFHRDNSGDPIYFGKELKGENKLIEKIVRSNSLFLSAAAQNAHPQLSKIYEFFEKNLIISTEEAPLLGREVANFFKNNPSFEEKAVDFLRLADTGISDITYETEKPNESKKQLLNDFADLMQRHNILPSGGPNPFTETAVIANLMHKGDGGKEYKLDIDYESAGTKALLSVIGPILKCLNDGGVLLIDELSNTLHPLLSRKLVSLFSDSSKNLAKAQLVFTTHDTNLLCGGLFRRDQIWFAEKDRIGGTHLYPLTDIEVDKRDNLEKGYLQGRFGAIPFLGNVDQIWIDAKDVEKAGREEA